MDTAVASSSESSSRGSPFALPPRVRTDQGTVRRAGFEFEFAGMTVEDAARVVQATFGGHVDAISTFHHVVRTPLGKFSCEIDLGLLKDKKYEGALRSLGIDPDKHDLTWLEKFLLGAGGTVAPIEIGMPPLPVDDLEPGERLRTRLRDAGAKGTRVVPWYAFGMHINVEIPSADAGVLRDYLRAFVLLYPWLKQRAEVTFTRSVAPFINPFPDAYVDLILRPGYAPDRTTLIDDYLAHNATRNRPLDMLPVLMDLDADRVRAKVTTDLALVKPRPAFHYRLPNSMLDEPDWTLAREWNTWVAVERLTGDPDRIADMAAAYAEAQRRSFKPFYDRWPGVLVAHATELAGDGG